MQLRNKLLITLFFLGTVFPLISQDITVATFNAEFLNTLKVHMKFGKRFDITREPKDVQEFWNNDANRLAKLKEASANVAQLIKQMKADILTLTEVGGKEDIKVLVSELKRIGVDYKYWEVGNSTDKFTGQHVAVLSKYPLKEVWPQIPGKALYFKEPDGDYEGETSISKGMKVTATINQKDVDIFVLHFISERKGYESDAKRMAQASIARRSIIKQLQSGRQVIVAGDLNSERRSESLYRLRGFDDIYEELIQTGHTEYFKNYDVRWTYNFRGQQEQIDHILISTGLAKRKSIKTHILEVNNEKVSDHNPVIVKLTLK